MIGIIGAMQIEIEGIKNLMHNIAYKKFAHMKFFTGKIDNIDCIVALCGPGKVNAAICAQIMVYKYRPKIIINVGVAGALDKKLNMGDPVLADFVLQHDIDTSAVGDACGLISGLNLIKIPCSKNLNKIIEKSALKLRENIHIGIIATGDQFISNTQKRWDIKSTFNAIACEMEAGSIGQVCLLNKIEFSVIKVISDNSDEQSHIDYDNFKSIVTKKITQLIKTFITNFEK